MRLLTLSVKLTSVAVSNIIYCKTPAEKGGLSFEWDSKKAETNARKHGVTFEEAKTVFFDDRALVIPDPDHSENEERFIIMGQSAQSRMLVVVHCFRQSGAMIRLISARRARTKEQKPYWEQKT